jgi:hypothetical protein
MSVTCDLIGIELEEVQDRLTRAGVQVRVVHETRPPRERALAGPLRVVRVRGESAGPVDLVVSRERYVPPLNPQ